MTKESKFRSQFRSLLVDLLIALDSLDTIQTKVCALCRKEKVISEFNFFVHSSDGYQGYCRDCNRAYCQGYSAGRQ